MLQGEGRKNRSDLVFPLRNELGTYTGVKARVKEAESSLGMRLYEKILKSGCLGMRPSGVLQSKPPPRPTL